LWYPDASSLHRRQTMHIHSVPGRCSMVGLCDLHRGVVQFSPTQIRSIFATVSHASTNGSGIKVRLCSRLIAAPRSKHVPALRTMADLLCVSSSMVTSTDAPTRAVGGITITATGQGSACTAKLLMCRCPRRYSWSPWTARTHPLRAPISYQIDRRARFMLILVLGVCKLSKGEVG
jgi:hypothetical protein